MAKKLNVIAVVLLGVAAVGLILAIVGMCTGIVSGEGESIGLFHEVWEMIESIPQAEIDAAAKAGITIPSRTFTLVAFIITLLGVALVLAHCVLSLIGKNIKVLGLVAGAVALVGGVLVLVAGIVLAGTFDKYLGSQGVVGAGIGVWLGFIGGLLAGVAGILSALKVGQKE